MVSKRKSSRPPPPAKRPTEPPPATSLGSSSLTGEEFRAVRELVSGRPELVPVEMREQLVAAGWLTREAGAFLLTEPAREFLRGPIDPSFYGS